MMVKKWSDKIFVILLIVAMGMLFNIQTLSEFPSHIHAWSQSDRYALSLGFIDNNFNFFKPQTFIKNHQFPGDWNVPSTESITSVDFPVHEYIAAIFMKLTGNHSPLIFRLYILLYSFFGLFFLYKLSELITGSFLKSIFIVVFAATSPVFIYYQDGFLPSVPSFSNAIIGTYFYIRHLKTRAVSNFPLSVLFLTLAALSRTTFVIPLIAVLGVEFLRIVRKESSFSRKAVPVILSFSAIGGYYFYNQYLTGTYGSIYLNHFMPADDWMDALIVIKEIFSRWGTQYFSLTHWILLLVLLVGACIWWYRTKKRINSGSWHFGLLFVLLMIGNFLFSFFMLKQFRAHDYYFIDTFMFPMLVLLILLLSKLPDASSLRYKIACEILILMICIPLVLNGVKTQQDRRETGPWDLTAATINNFSGSKEFLDSLEIEKDANILVLNASAPNIPFIMMERKGYVIMSTSAQRLTSALSWDYDFIVFQNDYFVADIFGNFPEIVNKIEKIADNGKITICRKNEKDKRTGLAGFLQIGDEAPLLSQSMSFDIGIQPLWSNINFSGDCYLSPSFSGLITEEMEFGPTFKINSFKPLAAKRCLLFLSCSFLHSEMENCEMVVSMNTGQKNFYYQSNNLKPLLKKEGQWEKVELIYQLPKVETPDFELGIYIYNPGRNKIYLDDFNFKIL